MRRMTLRETGSRESSTCSGDLVSTFRMFGYAEQNISIMGHKCHLIVRRGLGFRNPRNPRNPRNVLSTGCVAAVVVVVVVVAIAVETLNISLASSKSVFACWFIGSFIRSFVCLFTRQTVMPAWRVVRYARITSRYTRSTRLCPFSRKRKMNDLHRRW